MPLFWSWWLYVRPSQAKSTLHPLPQMSHQDMFLPDDPSYQDIWHQPLLLTMAYAQLLQYWVEKSRPPAHLHYHPLVMSILRLMDGEKEHDIFYKQDILWGLGRIALETEDWDPAVPEGTPSPNPPQLTLEAWSQTPLKARRHMVPLPHCLDLHLRRRPHQSNLLPHLLQMMLGILCLALQTLHQREMPQSFKPNPKWRTGQLVKMLALLRL